MEGVVNLYKPVSLTPLQVIEQFRASRPEYRGARLGYAGRLDPMAHGVLLVLCGAENRRRGEYERLAKEYDFSVLFGLATDTYDVMGKISDVCLGVDYSSTRIQPFLPEYIGRWEQPYPPYSSALYQGKPLYYWARKGLFSSIKVPSKEIEVHDLQMKSVEKVEGVAICTDIVERVEGVAGDFRQQEILYLWNKFFFEHKEAFLVGKFSIQCSSGVYVRGIADDLGRRLGGCALAYSICRRRVGNYTISDSVRV